MSPRHRMLLADRVRGDVHAAVCAAHPRGPELDHITLKDVVVNLKGTGEIEAKYGDGTVVRLRLGDLEVIDEPLDKPQRQGAPEMSRVYG